MTTTELDQLLSYARDKRLGLTALHCLLTISEEEQKLSFIADYLGVSSSAMTGHADALEAADLARRVNRSSDRRASYLQITAKGGDLVTNCLLGPAYACAATPTFFQ